jgi:Ni/Fe-hydrogenase subunit HybB-like protein
MERRLISNIEHTSKGWYVSISLLTLIILWGVYALYRQIVDGHIITGMRDQVVWGLYIANFIFFIGISYAGALISGILYLLKVEWRKPIIRIAEAITVVSTIIGPIFILLCMGRLDRLPYLAFYGRIQSPIIWDVIAISIYLIGSIIFLYLTLLRDFAVLRDYPGLKVSKWRKWLYKYLSINYKNTPEQKKNLDKALTIMSAIIIPIAIIVHSVLAWIFGMTLRPGWHSTIFGPYFVIAAIYSGTAVLLILMWIFRKAYHLEDIIVRKHFDYIGIILIILGAIYGYFTFSEYLTGWYTSELWESRLLDKLFGLSSDYGLLFSFSVFFGTLLPLIVIGIPKFRNINSITFSAIIVVAALWIKRYLIIVPTLETPLIPIQDTRIEVIHYSPTWVEWSLTFGGVAFFILFFLLFSKFVPIVPVAELKDTQSEGKKNID